ncbi:MAG: GNAT family N-acetyltransferase [Dehalococcoidia bacterium]
MDLRITEVTDLDAQWPEIAPLFRALHEYHGPLTGGALAADWEAVQRDHIGSVEDGLVLSARSGDGLVGVANAHIGRVAPVFRELAFGFLDNMYVLPEVRGQGVGGTLLAAVEDWCRGRGVEDLRLSVLVANALGVDVWRASGFEPVSYVMSKRLVSERS